MLEAVKSVRAALDDFYGKLSDEQKAHSRLSVRNASRRGPEIPEVAPTESQQDRCAAFRPREIIGVCSTIAAVALGVSNIAQTRTEPSDYHIG